MDRDSNRGRSPTHLRPSDTVLLAGFVATAAGMGLLWTGREMAVAFLVLVLGASAFVLGLSDPASPSGTWTVLARVAVEVRRRARRAWLIGPGIGLSLAAAAAAGVDGVAVWSHHGLLWLAGCLCVAYGLWKRPQSNRHGGRPWPILAGLAVILAIGIALRVTNLGLIPYGVNGDEGAGGMAAWSYVTGARSNILDTSWHAFPSLYFWLLSLSQRLLGHGIVAIRLLSVIGGTLALIAAIGSARRMYGPLAAGAAGLILAGSHVHIMFSRIAVNNVWDGAFFALLPGIVWVAWQTNERWAFLLAGATIGLSQYFYTTSHLIPAYAVLWVLLLARMAPASGRSEGLRAMALLAAVIALPLAVFYIRRPGELLAPMASVTLAPGGPALQYVTQLQDSLLGFITLDTLGIYHPGAPLLLPLTAILLLAALLLLGPRWRDPRALILLTGLIGPVLASAFSLEPPNSHRLQIALPLVAILIGAGASLAAERLAETWPGFRRAAVPVVVAVCTIAAGIEAYFFFAMAMPGGAYGDRSTTLARAVGDSLASEPAGTEVYLFGAGTLGFETFPSLPYLAGEVNGHDLAWPIAGEAGMPAPPPGSLFLLLPETLDAEAWIEGTYPIQARRDTLAPDGELIFRSIVIGAGT